jgi:fucose permease
VRVIIASAIVIFIYGMLASMLGTIVPGLGVRLSLGTLQLSYLALAQGIGLAATSVWAGALMDRSGRKTGVLLGLVASIVGLVALAHASGLSIAAGAMVLLGVGGSLVIVGANALVNDVSAANRASALNILNLFVGLGGMTTPLVAANLLHSDPTGVAYVGIGIATVALALVLLTPIQNLRTGSAPASVVGVFNHSQLYILSTITLLYTACEFAMWNWLPKYLIGVGVTPAAALNILSLGFACGILIGRLVAARLLVHTAPMKVLFVCATMMCLTTLALLNLSSVSALAVLVFVAGLAMAPVFPTTIAIVGRLFPERSATAIGFAITCGFSGLVVSSPLIGLVAGHTPQGIGHALLLIPVLSAVITLILLVSFRQLSAERLDPRPLFGGTAA